MDIRNHLLEGECIKFIESPNQGCLFSDGLPDTIIIHFTAGSSAESSVVTLCDPKSKASAHVVIGQNGLITQLVPFNKVAWHAGKSSYMGRSGFNRYSIGIEIDNAGRLIKSCDGGYQAWFGGTFHEGDVIEAVHRNETVPAYWHAYKEEQVAAVYDLCVNLVDTYGITSILGHEEISPNRKCDPGPAFPLDKLRERVLCRNRADDGPEDDLTLHRAGLVTASKLNIRSSPVISAITVAQPLSKGTVVDILHESHGWYEVEARVHGWVKKDYIKT